MNITLEELFALEQASVCGQTIQTRLIGGGAEIQEVPGNEWIHDALLHIRDINTKKAEMYGLLHGGGPWGAIAHIFLQLMEYEEFYGDSDRATELIVSLLQISWQQGIDQERMSPPQ
jgi:hypothetical protein